MIPIKPAPSLYLDTSVIGGYYDAEFMADTRALWRLAGAGRFRLFASYVVVEEIAAAPERVRKLMHKSFGPGRVLLRSGADEELARAYLAQNVVPTAYIDDARHVAVCSIARLDYLVSWNFKHLANVRRESGFNAVNILQGYPPVRIVPPTFFLHGQSEENI